MSIEKSIVIILAKFFRIFKIKGAYRLASMIYPVKSGVFKGVYCSLDYLEKKDNLKIQLFSKDLIDHKILFAGEYEHETNYVLRKYVKLGDHVIEAGANAGTETLLLSRLVGDQGKVWAFEPVPHLHKKLQFNCELNKITNVEFELYAIGDSDDQIDFYIADPSFVNQGMGTRYKIHQKVNNRITVEQVCLDTFVNKSKIDNLNFIKMDIQGAEIDLLRGGEFAIRKHNPLIFLEAGEGWSDLGELYDWLITNGHEIYLLKDGQELKINDRSMILGGNWLAKPV